MHRVHIIGAGLAGSEAAYFLAERGVQVLLYEMRPKKMTPAHETGECAELVCSNSLKSLAADSASGMLKTEMKIIGSLVLRAAGATAVPAGEALGVNRKEFSNYVSRVLQSHPNISLIREEVLTPSENGITIIASGPLTSDSLSGWILEKTGSDNLYFYDAIAPIVDASTIDFEKTFSANRYGKGDEVAYVNCPLDENDYNEFIEAIVRAEKVSAKEFEKFFQGCQPIEAIVDSGKESLRFGPMKPVGLFDPKTGKQPYAVLQLRPENVSRSAFNLVGFQTKLTYKSQKEVFSRIPALATSKFLRFGSIHRNTYVCAPRVLRPDLSLKGNPLVYLAGQITGVEGYMESAAAGLLAAIFVYQRLMSIEHSPPPANTAMGALLRHVTGKEPKNYQPSNMHFGLFDQLFFPECIGKKKDQQRHQMAESAAGIFSGWSELVKARPSK